LYAIKLDLGSSAARCESSSLSACTKALHFWRAFFIYLLFLARWL